MDPNVTPPDSATIMLIPDATYRAARPKVQNPHLMVAYFGRASALTPNGLARLHSTVDSIARFQGGPIPAVANGVGIFNAGRDGVAVVDLIDGIGTLDVRIQIENGFGQKRFGYQLDNVKLDYTHGFTPHITREYLERSDDFYAEVTPDMIDNTEFTFDAIGLWFGPNRYEVQL